MATDPRASAVLAQISHRRLLAATIVPTNDSDVRTRLRSLAEPITLFGEGPAERRDRLRELVAAANTAQQNANATGASGLDGDGDVVVGDAPIGMEGDGEEQEAQAPPQEEFYTEGPEALLAARQAMARFSLRRSRANILRQKKEAQIPLRVHVKHRNEIKERLRGFELIGSQTAERPVSCVQLGRGQAGVVAVGDWGGKIRVLGVPDLDAKRVWKAHSDRVRGVVWMPGSEARFESSYENADGADTHMSNADDHSTTIKQGKQGANQEQEDQQTDETTSSTTDLITAGGDGAINFWSLSSSSPSSSSNAPSKPLSTIAAHEAEIRALALHPSNEYLASASSDTTWSLWSLDRAPSPTSSTVSSSPSTSSTPLMISEAHASSLHTLSFSPTGSLLLSAGADSLGRIWDLRTGRTIMLLEGHVRDIHAADWGTDGYRVLTGSADGLAMCWDVRAVRATARIPLHARGVTGVRWWKGDGDALGVGGMESLSQDDKTKENTTTTPTPPKGGTFLVSGGFDKQVSITSALDWAPVRQLAGHEGHVLSVDVGGQGGRWVVSGGYDRTVKVWGRDDALGV